MAQTVQTSTMNDRFLKNIALLETASFVVEEEALKTQDDKLFGAFHILRDVIDDLKELRGQAFGAANT